MLKKLRKLRQKVLKGSLGTKVLVYCLLFVFGFLAVVLFPLLLLDLPFWVVPFLPIFCIVPLSYITRSEEWTMGSIFRRHTSEKKIKSNSVGRYSYQKDDNNG